MHSFLVSKDQQGTLRIAAPINEKGIVPNHYLSESRGRGWYLLIRRGTALFRRGVAKNDPWILSGKNLVLYLSS